MFQKYLQWFELTTCFTFSSFTPRNDGFILKLLRQNISTIISTHNHPTEKINAFRGKINEIIINKKVIGKANRQI